MQHALAGGQDDGVLYIDISYKLPTLEASLRVLAAELLFLHFFTAFIFKMRYFCATKI
jgi:hypothetical protein